MSAERIAQLEELIRKQLETIELAGKSYDAQTDRIRELEALLPGMDDLRAEKKQLTERVYIAEKEAKMYFRNHANLCEENARLREGLGKAKMRWPELGTMVDSILNSTRQESQELGGVDGHAVGTAGNGGKARVQLPPMPGKGLEPGSSPGVPGKQVSSPAPISTTVHDTCRSSLEPVADGGAEKADPSGLAAASKPQSSAPSSGATVQETSAVAQPARKPEAGNGDLIRTADFCPDHDSSVIVCSCGYSNRTPVSEKQNTAQAYSLMSDSRGWHIVASGGRKVVTSLPTHQEAQVQMERLRRMGEDTS